MTAKDYLSQAYHMELQVESKLQQIEALRSLITTIHTGISPTGPVQKSHDPTKMKNTVIRIMKMEDELNRQTVELVDKKRRSPK